METLFLDFHIKMKTGKIITAIKPQGVHDIPRDAWPELVFQFYQFLLIDLVLLV